jgi:hypothetical protein
MPKKQNKKQSGKGAYDYIARNVFGASLKDGEIHAPQYTKDGFRFGKFIGPGTDVFGGIKTKAVPVSGTDKTAKLHDINYTLSQNVGDVRAADLRMIKKLEQLQRDKSDYKFNTYMGSLPIKTKMKLEDWGIIRKGAFSSMTGNELKKEDRELLETERDALHQEGFGKKKKANTASPWIMHVKAYAKANTCSYKTAMVKSKASYKSSK